MAWGKTPEEKVADQAEKERSREGEESRDKFLASGQLVAVRGRVVGYYVFERREID